MAHSDAFTKIVVAFEGYVSVGPALNSRKKLYARIENDALVLYKSAPLKTPKGNISLADVKRLTGALPTGFPVPPATLSSSAWFSMEGGNRTYVFNAGNASARDQWISVLKDLITTGSNLGPGEDELLVGDLIKCDGKGKSWKNRNFVVSSSSRSMMYFEKAMEESSRITLAPQSAEEYVTFVPVSDSSCSADLSFCLISQGRKLIITASDSRDYAAWLQALTRATQPSAEPKRATHVSSPSLDLVMGSGNFFEMVNIARTTVTLREGVMKKKNKMKMWSPRYYVLQHVVERGYQDVLLSDAENKAEYVRGLIKNSSSCRTLLSASFHTSKSGKATKGGCRIDLTFDDEILPLRCADFSEAKEWVDQFNLVSLMCEGMREPVAPTQELPPSHPLYMRPEKKDNDKEVHGPEADEIQETDEFAKGILEKKKFNQWKPFMCSVNKIDDVPKLLFSSASSSSSTNSIANARSSQVQHKVDVISCDLIAEVELCTSGKGASEGRRFNVKLKSGQLISLRAKTFETCSRWVTVLDNLKSPEFTKTQEDLMPLPALLKTSLAKTNLGPPVSCVAEHLFSTNLVLTGPEAYRINPLVTVWVYDGEFNLKDVSLSYPLVDFATNSTGMCVAIAGMNHVDLDESSIVFTSNPLTDRDTSASVNVVLSPRKRFVDDAQESDKKDPSTNGHGSNDDFFLNAPPPPSNHISRAASDPLDPPSPPSTLSKVASDPDMLEPSEAPPEPPDRDFLFNDDPPPPPSSAPASRRASPASRAPPPLSRRTSPATPMDTPPSFPLADANDEMSELSISSQLFLSEGSSRVRPPPPNRLPPATPTRVSIGKRASLTPSVSNSILLQDDPLQIKSAPINNTPTQQQPPLISQSVSPRNRAHSNSPSLSSHSESSLIQSIEEKLIDGKPEKADTKEGDLIGNGLRRVASLLTRGSLKKPGTALVDSDLEDFADDGEANLIFDSSHKNTPSAEKPKHKASSAWVHLGSTEVRDCPPSFSRDEKEKDGVSESTSSTRSMGPLGAGTVVHPFRVLVPLYAAGRPGSGLVVRDHPEQVVVNTTAAPDTLIRFSVFHVNKKDDPDSVNLKEAEELATCVTSLRALSSQTVSMNLKNFSSTIQASLQIQHFGPFTAEVSSCFGAIARKSFSFPSTYRAPQHPLESPPLPIRPPHDRGSSMVMPTLERLSSDVSSITEADDEEFICLVHEKLTQSPFTFSVPALVLQESIVAKTALVRRLTDHIAQAKLNLAELKTIPEAMAAVVKAGVVVHPFVSHSKLVSGLETYLKLLEGSLREQEHLLQMYLNPSAYLAQYSSCVTNPSLLGVPFRSSVAKKVSSLRYIPTNLHLHTTVVKHQRKAELHEEPGSTLYDITSVGASVDHVAGFKKGDITILQAAVQDMTQELAALDLAIEKATNKELQDLEEKRCVVELKLQQADTELLSRKECVLAQSLAVLVSSFVSKLQACVFGNTAQHSPAVLARLGALGFLFQVESLLSTIYDEAHMLADYEYSVKQLQRVQFRLVRREDSDSGEATSVQMDTEDAPSYSLASQVRVRIQPPKADGELLFAPLKLHIPTIRKSGYTSRNLTWKHEVPRKSNKLSSPPRIVLILELPNELYSRLPPQLLEGSPDGASSPRGARLINVVSVFFNQGVNEMQSLAISLGKVDQQKEINSAAKHSLETYATNFIGYCQRHPDTHSENLIRAVRDGLEQLNSLLQGKQHKDIQLLKVCNRLSRLMCSGNVVSCKSAKDRTSMSITWETAMALQEWHGVKSRHTQGVMDLTRAHGVRRKNVLKNTRKKAYAFNAIQRRALPSALCPPEACCGKTQS